MKLDFSHLQIVDFNVQVGENLTPMVGIFNTNKLPTGVAIKCIETNTPNIYLLTMTQAHFVSLFLDDAELNATAAASTSTADAETSESNSNT